MNAHTPVAKIAQESPVISDDLLARLANPEPCFQRGEISPELQAILVMVLPDLARELIDARRANTIPAGALCLAITPQAAAERVRKARIAVRADNFATQRDAIDAVKTLSVWSPDPAERQGARDWLAANGKAA